MSLNFSQNAQYLNQPQNGNFGAVNVPQVQEPVSYSILKGMGIPTTGDEFVKFAPFFGVSVVLSKIFSAFATVASRVNPFSKGVPAGMTVAESFENSFLGKLGRKIDNVLFPFLNKNKGKIDSARAGISKVTPDWTKNLYEKFKIGVAPKNNMALFQYRGATHAASNAFFDVLKQVKPSELLKLGLKEADVAQILAIAENTKAVDRKTLLQGLEFVADKFKNVKAKDLQGLLLKSGKKSYLLNELNKARAFIAPNAKTGFTKYLQKGLMYLSEGAGGGVIGGALFGILMNSLFMATTIKRTWEAPWKEKFSTFMEGLMVEFGGIYFTMVLGTRLTYKLLGLKNADKTAAQLANIKGLTETINAAKGEFKNLDVILKYVKKGNMTPELQGAIKEILQGINTEGLTPEIKQLISKTIGAEPVKKGFLGGLFRSKMPALKDLTKEEAIKVFEHLREVKGSAINSSIDNLAKMRAFQKVPKGGFFRNLFNRPLRWAGNFLSIGLENLPTKVGVKGVSKFRLFFSKLWNGVKFAGGYPLRFILVGMIVTPPLTNLLGKISHTLFGKPTKSIMDERDGKNEETKNQQIAQQQNPQNPDKMLAYSQITKQLGQLRSAYEQQQKQQTQQVQPSLLTATLKNKQEAINMPKPQVQQASKKDLSPATYIPQVKATQIADAGKIDEINRKLAQSENVEKYAMKELNSLHTKNDAYEF
ncbi:MAG: hypothetical protein MJ180_00880 [Candidatus Gastranaerophilales bacterium]|nr:hypothetical protein [Candidatus Gastranaerophilales bacterium]